MLVTLALVTLTALAGGYAARLLRQPPLLGYLAGGMLAGPHGFGLIQHAGDLESAASMGLVLLMFALGAELSLGAVLRMGALPLVAGAVQLGALAALWAGLAGWFGWSPLQGALFGYLLAISSTAIVLKLLADRGDLDSIHGRILVGILVFQDVTVVPVMVLLSGGGPESAEPLALVVSVGSSVVKAVVVLGGMLLLGLVVAPRVLERVARLLSHELFVLTVFAIVLGTAVAAVGLGLSVALGAFVAGIVVSESEYSHQALADVVPLRDIFASFFFVSLGMLTDAAFLWHNAGVIALAVLTVVLVGCGAPALVTRAFGYPLRPALLVASGSLPMGEFNFVIAATAVSAGVAQPDLLGLVLGTALVTLVAAPAANQAADRFYLWVQARRAASTGTVPEPQGEDEGEMNRHAVIFGFGRTGETLAGLLTRRNIPCMVVDLDPRAIARARAAGLTVVFGDVGSHEVIARCHLERARVLVIAVSDPQVVGLAIQNALRVAPRLDIVARVPPGFRVVTDGQARLELVEPKFEAGLEIVRHTLQRFGLTSQETQLILTSLRQNREPA